MSLFVVTVIKQDNRLPFNIYFLWSPPFIPQINLFFNYFVQKRFSYTHHCICFIIRINDFFIDSICHILVLLLPYRSYFPCESMVGFQNKSILYLIIQKIEIKTKYTLLFFPSTLAYIYTNTKLSWNNPVYNCICGSRVTYVYITIFLLHNRKVKELFFCYLIFI